MHLRTWPATALALFATLGAALAGLAPSARAEQPDDALRAMGGEWIYVEDRTEGRALEQLGPPMSNNFTLRIEEGAVILVWGHGGSRRDVRVALDGSITEFTESERRTRYRGTWKDGTFEYQVEFVQGPDKAPEGLIRRDFRMTPDGLLVRAAYESKGSFATTLPFEAVGLYRHAQDIPLPTPAKAAIGDLAWLAGAWVGTRSSGSSIEERWSPLRGGAMLAVSRTVNTSGKMVAFEFLRIVERDGGLVYIAQPGGAKPTEFVLIELSAETGSRRAVFDNPRHDYPKRIVYELSAEGGLRATIGYTKGGTPQHFEFKREAPSK
jgi:hypothetical protein